MFVIKQNDTSPALRADLKDPTGAAVNVTAATVRFMMRDTETKTVKINVPASIITGTTGTVQYDWQTGDTDTVGAYEAEFQVTFVNGKIETFPNNSYIKIKIVGEIA